MAYNRFDVCGLFLGLWVSLGESDNNDKQVTGETITKDDQGAEACDWIPHPLKLP